MQTVKESDLTAIEGYYESLRSIAAKLTTELVDNSEGSISLLKTELEGAIKDLETAVSTAKTNLSTANYNKNIITEKVGMPYVS